MSILLSENLLSLAEAARSLPGRPHISSLWRWHRHGVRGVRLETLLVAGRRFTSLEALKRFVAATTAAADGKAHALPLQKSNSAVDAELDRELGTPTVLDTSLRLSCRSVANQQGTVDAADDLPALDEEREGYRKPCQRK